MTNKNEMPDLKRCPLDGGRITHHTDTAFHHGDRGYKPKSEDFTCNSCGLRLCVRGDDITKAEAYERWNTRADLVQHPVDLEALKRDVYINHIKSAGYTDEMVAEELSENPDWGWGYQYAAKESVDAAIDHLYDTGRINGGWQPTEDAQRALDAFKKLKVNAHSGSPEDYGDDVGFESAENVSDWANEHYKTILAALAKMAGK